MKILKILIFHCICLYFYLYTWSNFTKFDFDQTSYALYFGQDYMFLEKSVTSIKKGSQFIGT
jgi:hypothetical protein